MSVQVLYLPDYLPTSLNKSVGRHWSVKAKQKKSDRELVAHYAGVQGLRPNALTRAVFPAKRRVDLRVVLPKGQRAPDPDNLWKNLLDSLVHAGLLFNDTPRYCEPGKVEYVRHEGTLKEVFIILTDI